MKKTVILISGKIKSGKNEAANILQRYFEEKGFFVSQDYFAKAVKEYCKKDFQLLAKALNEYAEHLKTLLGTNISKESLDKINELKISDENWFEDKTFITRVILQLYGTEIFRNRVNDNYWVNILKEKCEKSEYDFMLISDLRFPNEYYGMNSDKYNIISIRLLRDINKGKSKHPSEISLDDFECWNHVVDNRKNNIKSFTKQIEMIGKEILENLNNEEVIDYSNNLFEPQKDIKF